MEFLNDIKKEIESLTEKEIKDLFFDESDVRNLTIRCHNVINGNLAPMGHEVHIYGLEIIHIVYENDGNETKFDKSFSVKLENEEINFLKEYIYNKRIEKRNNDIDEIIK
jgi:hypothetical protein